MKPVLELFNQIMGLRGVRQVTVATHYLGACKCDITDSGVIGYDVAHGVLLLEHLEEAVENGGGVIVRQFQAEKIYVVTRAGSRLVPVKHIFGVRAGQGRWTGLSSEAMRAAHTTDSESGNALAPEKGVRFLDWSAGVEAPHKKG